MLDQLIPLLGMRVDSKEIKDIFTEWNAIFPKRVTCTTNEPNIKGKIEKNAGANIRKNISNPKLNKYVYSNRGYKRYREKHNY